MEGTLDTRLGGSFSIHTFSLDSLKELARSLDAKSETCDIPARKSGFTEIAREEGYLIARFRAVLVDEVQSVADASGNDEPHTVEVITTAEAELLVFKDAVLVHGKPRAKRPAIDALARLSQRTLAPAGLSPARLLGFSDQMTLLRTVELDGIEHDAVKKVRFEGKMESMADIAPFHAHLDHLKSIRGLVKTPHGLRLVRVTLDGRLSLTLKRDEELQVELLRFLFERVYRAAPKSLARDASPAV